MKIEWLSAREDLIPELAEWHLAEWGGLHPGQTLTDRIQGLRRCCGDGAMPRAVVATRGEVLLGSALLVEHDMDARPELSPWLAGVFVKPAFRGAGVATQLVRRIESEALALGVTTLYLYTDKEADFYARRGWRARESCMYRGLAVCVMARDLTAA